MEGSRGREAGMGREVCGGRSGREAGGGRSGEGGRNLGRAGIMGGKVGIEARRSHRGRAGIEGGEVGISAGRLQLREVEVRKEKWDWRRNSGSGDRGGDKWGEVGGRKSGWERQLLDGGRGKESGGGSQDRRREVGIGGGKPGSGESRSLDEHVEHVRTVLERLRQAKYKANHNKCEFAQQELEYLGHYVTPQGIRLLADKIEALRVWPEPCTYDEVTVAKVLEQHDGDDWHPVEYFSHKVPPINSLDDARKKELLAFVMALKRWRHFLLGRRKFTWITDNNPLTYYKTQDMMSSTIGRWMYFIDQFDFTSKHVPGLSNRAADALSRRLGLCAMTHHAFAFDEELQRHFIRAYQSDPDFGTLYAQLSSDHPPASHYRIVDGAVGTGTAA
ncbi:hypothetical protein CBR_g18591 [Chara braunii]|uniref:Reverse transcriptase RNase H-like domain-containing protein n=1 Tax=Chara braunii TaxID=69332 RepID=A0A388JT83_CHABU|nr:hypothetical protein CBR_g18591 [Chara braunii]|eukprot:GBG60995.1 hypothetical protein CBR_g18591 [Chara braunii]